MTSPHHWLDCCFIATSRDYVHLFALPFAHLELMRFELPRIYSFFIWPGSDTPARDNGLGDHRAGLFIEIPGNSGTHFFLAFPSRAHFTSCE